MKPTYVCTGDCAHKLATECAFCSGSTSCVKLCGFRCSDAPLYNLALRNCWLTLYSIMSSRNSAPRGNACVPCRTRKVVNDNPFPSHIFSYILVQKCGGEKPSCGVCIQAGRLCEYAARLNITQKLEKKVQELQDQLYQATVAQTRSSSRSVPRFGVLALQVQALRPPALPQIPSLAVLPGQLQTWNANDEVPPQLRLNMYVYYNVVRSARF